MTKHYLITSCNAQTKVFTSKVYDEETILASDYAPAIQELKKGEATSWIEQCESYLSFPFSNVQDYVITITRLN